MKDTHKKLDELIRQRIAGLPPDTPPAKGWDDLARKLDTPVAGDAIIADKLDALSPTLPAGAWEAFAPKLIAAETLAAEQVDELVANGLQRANPVTASGWALLAARLELIGSRREMVFCMKITETALLLSALLLFVRFGTVTPAYQSPVAATDTLGEFPIEALAEQEAPAPASDNETVPTTANSASTPEITAPAPAAQVISKDVVVYIAKRPLPTRVYSTAKTVVPDAQVTEEVPTEQFAVAIRERPVHPALTFPTLFQGLPVKYYWNAFVSPFDLNQVITPENLAIGQVGGSRLTHGYSIGSLIDFKQGNNGLQIGMVFGRRSYVPSEILKLQNALNAQDEIEDVQYGRLTYNTLTLPLNYERGLHSWNDWHLSASLGMAMNIILESNFLLAEGKTSRELESALANFRASNSTPQGRSAETSSTHNVINPDPGYLEGGSLLDNSSFYINGSITIERDLDDRWSLYFAPTVSRLFTVREKDGGKGPLEDRIHNTMLRMGTRMRIGE